MLVSFSFAWRKLDEAVRTAPGSCSGFASFRLRSCLRICVSRVVFVVVVAKAMQKTKRDRNVPLETKWACGALSGCVVVSMQAEHVRLR